MASHDTEPAPGPAKGRNPMASVTNINTVRPDDGEPLPSGFYDMAMTAMTPLAPDPLAYGAVLGYFRHGGYCLKVEYIVPKCLWLWVSPYSSDTGPLTGFDAYERLEYTEFGSTRSEPGYLHLTYRGNPDDPKWMALSPVSQADLMRKALALYAYAAEGTMLNAADDLVPNPSPERSSPNAA